MEQGKIIQITTYRHVKGQVEKLKSKKLQELLINGASEELQGYLSALKDVINLLDEIETEALDNLEDKD